jgi:cytidine deaminase
MSELSEETIAELLSAAAEVRANAWAPYSGFKVGAAILDGAGRVHVGCNVENASYGLSVCAERHAIAAAVAAGGCDFKAVVVVTPTSPPATPCGACRQVLAEFGDLAVILANPQGERRVSSSSDLLPDAFTPEILGTNREPKR